VHEATQTHSRHLLATLTPAPRHDRACRGSRKARACACDALRRFEALLTRCACCFQICLGPVCVPVGALAPTLIVFAHQRGWLRWLQPRWFDWRWYRTLLRKCVISRARQRRWLAAKGVVLRAAHAARTLVALSRALPPAPCAAVSRPASPARSRFGGAAAAPVAAAKAQ
jgi:hypothetical protein